MRPQFCFAFIFGAASPFAAIGAPDGFLDPTFGQDGLQIVAFDLGSNNNDVAGGMAVLPDGRILMAGAVSHAPLLRGIGLARLTADGQVDDSFGQPWHLPAGLESVSAINDAALQPDGKLVVVGKGGPLSSPLVCRFHADGSLDTEFASLDNPYGTGCRAVPVAGFDTGAFAAVVIQRDGRIALAGSAVDEGFVDVLRGLVVRLDAQGNFDTSFDSDGINVLQSDTMENNLHDIAETPDGDLVAVGDEFINPNFNWKIFRLRGEDGALDPEFDGVGFKTIAIDLVGGGNDQAKAVSVLSDGRIVIGGQAQGANGTCPAVGRLLPDGEFDESLDGGGLFTPANACLSSLVISDMLVQSDGRIVLAGGWNNNFNAVRVLPLGGFDNSFGIFNSSWFDFAPMYGLEQVNSVGRRIANQGGRLLFAGYATPAGPGGSDFAIARLDNDQIFADDFE